MAKKLPTVKKMRINASSGIGGFLKGLLCAALLAAGSNFAAAQNIPELMYFRFDTPGPSIPNEAAPATRVSVAGTLAGGTVGGAGQFSTALQGNSTTANMFDAGWALNLSGPWTISMWFSGVTNALSSNYFFGGAGGSTFRALSGSGLVAGAGNLELRATGMTDIFLNNVFNATGSPVVLTIVYDPTALTATTYVNGVFNGTTAQPAGLTLTGTNFTIGNYGGSTSLPSGGRMDEFRMYNRALTSTEIGITWNQPLPLTPLRGYADCRYCNRIACFSLSWCCCYYLSYRRHIGIRAFLSMGAKQWFGVDTDHRS